MSRQTATARVPRAADAIRVGDDESPRIGLIVEIGERGRGISCQGRARQHDHQRHVCAVCSMKVAEYTVGTLKAIDREAGMLNGTCAGHGCRQRVATG